MPSNGAHKPYKDVVKASETLLKTNYQVLYDNLDANRQEELVRQLADVVTFLEEFVVQKRPNYWKERMET